MPGTAVNGKWLMVNSEAQEGEWQMGNGEWKWSDNYRELYLKRF
jgi:hypothetical protein